MSAHLIVPEGGGTELAVRKASQELADAVQSPSRHRVSGLIGLALILLMVFFTLYLALRYMT